MKYAYFEDAKAPFTRIYTNLFETFQLVLSEESFPQELLECAVDTCWLGVVLQMSATQTKASGLEPLNGESGKGAGKKS